jgi:hypothetical protein
MTRDAPDCFFQDIQLIQNQYTGYPISQILDIRLVVCKH